MREIDRRRALEAKRLAGGRMLETQHCRVQSLAAEARKRRPCGLVEKRGLGLEPRAIDRIAQERMTDRGHVDPDLVGPPGLQPAGDEARRSQGFLEAPMGGGMTA